MQLNASGIKDTVRSVYSTLFGGRIARTTFVIRVGILGAAIFILAAPLNTILVPSSKTLRDVYLVLFLGMSVLCLIGILSAYVKRLHDIGLAGYWAALALIGLPAIIMYIGSAYSDYRYDLDQTANLSGFNDATFVIALALPLVLALWPGEKAVNKFGSIPEPVEHVTASRFNTAAIVGAAVILIPASIYAGLFQDGVWVGRGAITPSMPMIDSDSDGRLLAKCWNLKGVGAGTGEGPLGGVYRDGYGGSVLDFVVSESGEIDIVPAGETLSKAYRADGFEILAYGLNTAEMPITTNGRSRFMIAAVYDGSRFPDGNVNVTTFSFAKTSEIWPEWQVIMASGLNLGEHPLLNPTEQARGRLMIGDCVVN